MSYGDKLAEKLAEKKKDANKRRKHGQKRKKQKEYWRDFKRTEEEIVELMKKTVKHPKGCNCEGCYWWAMTKTIVKDMCLYTIIRSWKEMDVDEFHRTHQARRRYALDRRIPRKRMIELLLKRGAPKDQVEKIADAMYEPVSIVMASEQASPAGLMRDI